MNIEPGSAAAPHVIHHAVEEISRRSRMILPLMRLFMKPMLSWVVGMHEDRLAQAQLHLSGKACPDSAGLPLNYEIVGNMPGHVLGRVQGGDRSILLWLHGGAFILPAAPNAHLVMVAKLCRDLGADGFVPDYRLAPFNRFPAALDDCENAYRALLDKGYLPSQIVIGGDSAGGNLALGVLQRLRKAKLPMPASAILMSPAIELGRIHGPPSRARLMKRDPILPIVALKRISELYAGDSDRGHPELSPLYMDCDGMPPTFFLTSDNEVLMDETLMLAARFHAAGAETVCHVWPMLPHAFPVFDSHFPEISRTRADIVAFAIRQLTLAASKGRGSRLRRMRPAA